MERRHQQDKRSEKGKSVSVATASRTSILRRYRRQAINMSRVHETIFQKVQDLVFTNVWGLARRDRPELAMRPRGGLVWEGHVDQAAMAATTQLGNKEALQAYVRDNREALDEELELGREKGTAARAQSREEILPVTSNEWMEWLEANDAVFRDHLKFASSRRAAVSHRLRGSADALPAGPRIFPKPEQRHVGECYAKRLQCRKGWFAVTDAGGAKVVISLASLRRQGRALLLEQMAPNSFRSGFSISLKDVLAPVEKVASAYLQAGERDELGVHQLDMTLLAFELQRSVHFKVTGAVKVVLREKAPRKAKDDMQDSDASESADILGGEGSDEESERSDQALDQAHELEEPAVEPSVDEETDGETKVSGGLLQAPT